MELSGLLELFGVKERSKAGSTTVYHCIYEGRNILVVKTGMGVKNSKLAAKSLINIVSARPVKRAVMVGVCGAADPQFKAGEIVIYGSLKNLVTEKGKIICTDSLDLGIRGLEYRKARGATLSFLADSKEIKAEIYQKFGVQAVDMESYYICRAALSHRIPFMVLRAVSDTAGQSLPGFMVDFSKNRKLIGTLKVINYIIKPSQAKYLWHTFKLTKTATANLTEAVRQLVLH